MESTRPDSVAEGTGARLLRPRAYWQMLLASALILSLISPLHSGEGVFYKELNLIGGHSRQDRWIGRTMTLANSVGFEDYRKFSSETGDFMTTDAQVRLAYYSARGSGGDRRAEDAWGVEVHNAWLDLRLAYGHKLRVGHFDVPFGLEPAVDTHGTVLQTLAMSSVGFKHDWGLAFRGSAERWDYAFGLLLGSGMGIRSQDGNFLVAARLGSPPGRNVEYGASLLYGRVLQSMDMRTFPRGDLTQNESVPKRMVGVDGQYLYGPVLLRGEGCFGRVAGEDAAGWLLETDFIVPSVQSLDIGLQIASWIGDVHRGETTDTALTLAFSYRLSGSSTLRAAVVRDIDASDRDQDTAGIVQFYYYGD